MVYTYHFNFKISPICVGENSRSPQRKSLTVPEILYQKSLERVKNIPGVIDLKFLQLNFCKVCLEFRLDNSKAASGQRKLNVSLIGSIELEHCFLLVPLSLNIVFHLEH